MKKIHLFRFEIFRHLSYYDIIRNLSAVCKNFHRLTQDSKLIKKIVFKGRKSKVPLNYEGLKNLTGLTTLDIGRHKDSVTILNTVLEFCPKLRHVEMKWFPAQCPTELSDNDMELMTK